MSTHVYVATDAEGCACISAACVDDPRHLKDTAKAVAGYLRRGDKVNRVPNAELRVMSWRCAAHPEGTPAPWELRRKVKAAAR